MTQDEFIAHILLVFRPNEDLSWLRDGIFYKRYRDITAYGMEVQIYEDNQVAIRYDLGAPTHAGWEREKGPFTFAEAWEFIAAFINEHPDK